MYKEVIIVALILIIIIGLNIFTQNYTKNSIEYINNSLSQLKTEIVKEEPSKEEISKKIEEIMKDWKDRYNKLAYFIEHDELEKVETELTSLKANLEMEEYEQSLPDLEKCIFILEHIKDKFSLKIKNIF